MDRSYDKGSSDIKNKLLHIQFLISKIYALLPTHLIMIATENKWIIRDTISKIGKYPLYQYCTKRNQP